MKKKYCDDLPSIKEFEEAIKIMKKNKSPGFDGIPVELYKLFWNEIKTYLYNALLKSFTVEDLTITQRMSIISLIHKKAIEIKIKIIEPFF